MMVLYSTGVYVIPVIPCLSLLPASVILALYHYLTLSISQQNFLPAMT